MSLSARRTDTWRVQRLTSEEELHFHAIDGVVSAVSRDIHRTEPFASEISILRHARMRGEVRGRIWCEQLQRHTLLLVCSPVEEKLDKLVACEKARNIQWRSLSDTHFMSSTST